MMRSDMLILAQSSIPPNIGVSLGSGRRFPISSRYHSHSLFSKSRSNPRNKGLFWQRHPIEFFPETGNLNYSDPNLPFRRVNDWVGVSTASMGVNSGSEMARKRNVVEHICLVITKAELSDEEEKDMLDYLYTTQYQMGGIVGMSLGRISVQNAENYTHAIYMRFQSKEDLMKFYENPFYLRIMEQHVMPYCHGLMNMDFESEVEDDILSIFRKGEGFTVTSEDSQITLGDRSSTMV